MTAEASHNPNPIIQTDGHHPMDDQPRLGRTCTSEKHHGPHWRVLERCFYRDPETGAKVDSTHDSIVCLVCVSIWRMDDRKARAIGIPAFAVPVEDETETNEN